MISRFTQFISLLLLFTFFPLSANAAAWWGEGYKTPQWVLAHGGTIIYYTVINGNPNKYKAIMYHNGQYVEVEFGKNANFDDAKNGTYTIIFYKCDDSCRNHKFHKKEKVRDKDKKVAVINIHARPGETLRLIFDAKNGTINTASRSGYIKPKTPTERTIERAIAVKNQTCTLKKYTPIKKTYLSQRQELPRHAPQKNSSHTAKLCSTIDL